MTNAQDKLIQEEMARNEPACEELIDVIQLIANKHRFRIICLLGRGDYCVGDIAEILKIDKVSNLSQQLKILKLAGVISSRRENKNVVYSLTNERVGRIISILREDFVVAKSAAHN